MAEDKAFFVELCRYGDALRDPVKCVKGLGLAAHPVAARCLEMGRTDAMISRVASSELKQVIYHVDGPSLHGHIDVWPSDFANHHRLTLKVPLRGQDAHKDFQCLWMKYALQFMKQRLSEWPGPLPFLSLTSVGINMSQVCASAAQLHRPIDWHAVLQKHGVFDDEFLDRSNAQKYVSCSLEDV